METKNIPVIMVTAKEAEYDKVRGLEAGADDYITKPFGMMEFVARVKAVLRRCSRQEDDKELKCDDLKLSVGRHKVLLERGKSRTDQKRNLKLLQYLMENKGLVMTRNQILCHVWGYDFDGDIETRVSQKDSASVLSVYRKNYNNVVKSEMEQVLISMAASNPQYPVNTTNKAAELMVEENLIANGYLKDFLYAYNYIDRWYDFRSAVLI